MIYRWLDAGEYRHDLFPLWQRCLAYLRPSVLPAGRGGAAKTRAAWVKHELDLYNSNLNSGDVAQKYCKMGESPFAFFRGSNHLFWADFAQDPRLVEFSAPHTRTWIQGDLHPYNFGTLPGAKGRVIYTLNDFDDSLIADYQFDLWRMAVALVLLGQSLEFRLAAQAEIVRDFGDSYLHTLEKYDDDDKDLEHLFTAKTAPKVLRKFVKRVCASDRADFLRQWLDRRGRFDCENPALGPVDNGTRAALTEAVRHYAATLPKPPGPAEYFSVLDVARRFGAGIGSLGRPRYYVLVRGPGEDPETAVILDVKYQQKVSAYPFLTPDAQADYDRRFDDQARRYVAARSALSGSPAPHLGRLELDGHSYSVRERSPYQDGVNVEKISDPKDMRKLAAAWGKILAVSHAQAECGWAGTDYDFARSVLRAAEGQRRAFRQQLHEVAVSYAAQVARDWQTFCEHTLPLSC